MGGGDPLYLSYWMRQSGLADLFETLTETVYVGVSAGSLVVGPCIGGDVSDLSPLAGGDSTLGVVDFAIFPHLDRPDMPDFDMANAARWASGLSVPGYAIDDETAIKVVDGVAEVVSEGHWELMTPSTDRGRTDSGFPNRMVAQRRGQFTSRRRCDSAMHSRPAAVLCPPTSGTLKWQCGEPQHITAFARPDAVRAHRSFVHEPCAARTHFA